MGGSSNETKNPTKNKNTKAHTQTQTSKQQTPKLLNGRKLKFWTSSPAIVTYTQAQIHMSKKVCNHQSHSRSSLKKMGLPDLPVLAQDGTNSVL